jgi:hypothetical protein
MEMQWLGHGSVGAKVRLARIEIVGVGMSRCAIVVRVDFSLPDPGEEQAKQRNA